MAEKKHNWTKIKKEYFEGKYKNIKELSEINNISYSYCKKQVAKWNKKKAIAEKMVEPVKTTKKEEVPNKTLNTSSEVPIEIVTPFESDIDVPIPEVIVPTKVANNIPNDRNKWLSSLWDKLALIVESALNEPEHNFFTNDGKIKTKALTDISIILEKVQKAQEGKDDKKTGQLGEYIEMFAMMKQAQEAGEE